MYLTCALLEHGPRLGYAVACHKPGPDVLLEFKDRCIWIEAITATDGDPAKPDSVGHPDPAKPGQIPDEKIVLRYTNAIDAKYRKYLEYLEKGIVAEEDSYLIAVNGYPLSYGWADPEIPRILKAVFPLGHLQFIFDRKTLKRVETKHQFRPAIFKSSGKDVSTAGFMSEQYAGISGILYSRANAYMTARPLGSDFLIAHNPMAGHPVRLGSLAADREYVAKPVDRDVIRVYFADTARRSIVCLLFSAGSCLIGSFARADNPANEILPQCEVRSGQFLDPPGRGSVSQPVADVTIPAEVCANMECGAVNVNCKLLSWNGEVGDGNRRRTLRRSDRDLLLGGESVLLKEAQKLQLQR
jgi:type I restriction enzyme S subunit